MDVVRARRRGRTEVRHPERIEHVVVLMLENRSFDHLLGFLDHPGGTCFNGLRPNTHFNVDAEGVPVYATNDGVPEVIDPDHSHKGRSSR